MAIARRNWRSLFGGPFLAGLLTVALVALLQWLSLPAIDRLGLLLFDSYQRAAPRAREDAPVRVVSIDEDSIRRLGQWPWPRTELARLSQELRDAGAAVIAWDIVFSEPDRTSPANMAAQLRRQGTVGPEVAALEALPDNDAAFARSLAGTKSSLGFFLSNRAGAPPVEPKGGLAIAGTAPSEAGRYKGAIRALPSLEAAASGSGFVSISSDGDGIVRQLPLLSWQGDTLQPALSLDALRQAQDAGAIVVKTSDASGESGGAPGRVVSVKVGQFEVPATAAGALWLHYTAPGDWREVPAWKVLGGAMSEAEREEAFAGRIVLVGASASGLRDLVSTPVRDRELGVVVHAQALEQMILGRFLVRPDWAPGLERALLLVLGLLLAGLAPRLGAVKGALLGLVLVMGMLGGSWLAFARLQYLLDPVYPVLTLVLAWLVVTVLVYLREERRRAYIHSAFDRYLPPEQVRRIAADPGQLELGGEERDMTVLLCDIRGFSRISEQLSPREVVRFLIAFQTPMCDILLAHKATLDKYIGDAILAFWNAPLDDPDQHENAARAALAMAARLDELNREMPRQQGEPWPGHVRMGIGIGSGLCCVGNLGSERRLSYSLIGDTVNLVSRLDGLTKHYRVPVIVDNALCGQLSQFALIELDRVVVLGRDEPETIHALLGDETMRATPAFAAFAAAHSEFMATRRANEWPSALQHLDRLDGLAARFGLEGLYAFYRDQDSAQARDCPERGWDGIFRPYDK
ncbi:MAG: CHASE2 domain-containing protein [Novosphingobium sp.]